MSLILYDDARARACEPFALTRPMGELRAGLELLRRRWEIALGRKASGAIMAPHLEGFDEPGAPPLARGPISAGAIIANARCAITMDELPDADAWRCNGRIAAVRIPAEVASDDLADGARDLDVLVAPNARVMDVVGWWIDDVWDLIRHLAAILEHDIERAAESLQTERGVNVTHLGRYPVYVERGAKVEPFVVADCTAGPVLICHGASVAAFTRLVGPCAIGRDSHVLGGRVATSSIGEACRVAGEVSNCIFTGHANKAHDGFVGHSVLGRWVNLGASTVTSNLKNTYGSVALWTPSGARDTGLQFLGSLLGDHAKTGIGTRLSTGTLIGAGANVVSDGIVGKIVMPFTWGDGGRYDLQRFLTVAERVMQRRGVTLSEEMRGVLARAHHRSLDVWSDAR